jgi:hypothetical protein
MMVWKMWWESPPGKTLTVVIADIPDGITRMEPIPIGLPFRASDMPPWQNVYGLMWRIVENP